MLPWKLRKCQILPVNQNLSSIYFPLAKFQLVSCNSSRAIIWQMTYTQKLPKLCSATLKRPKIGPCQENDTRSGRRFACRLYPSHGPLRFITSHSRFALASAMRKTKRLRRRLNFTHELTCQILTNQSVKIGRGA